MLQFLQKLSELGASSKDNLRRAQKGSKRNSHGILSRNSTAMNLWLSFPSTEMYFYKNYFVLNTNNVIFSGDNPDIPTGSLLNSAKLYF